MYIVTGGAGFIGSTLAADLMRQGKKVVVIDNLHTGRADNVPDGAQFLQIQSGDIGGADLSDVEGVYHLGIASSSPMYREDHDLTGEMIAEFCRIADFCVEKKVKLVFASTSSLYAGQPLPQIETQLPNAFDYYTEARFAMERIAKVYEQIYGLQWAGLRLFSVYGERERHKGKYANLITQFIWEARAGRTIKVFGDGTQSRDFIYADDVCRGFELAMQKGNGIYNIGTGQSHSLNQLLEVLGEEMGQKLEVERVNNPIKNYVQHTLADTSKSEKELGFKAEVSLDEGIRRLVAHYKKPE